MYTYQDPRYETVQILLNTRHMSGIENEYSLEDKRFGRCFD